MKHKHAELIKAWADGAQIQCFNDHYSQWQDTNPVPYWLDNVQYRIKPQQKQPVVRWMWAKEHIGGEWMISPVFRSKEEALKTFNGEFICLDWSRTEFPE